MLEFIDVTKQFETITAVKNVSFNVNNGEILGIVGRNGSGKSTIFRMILKLIEPTSGKILYNNDVIQPKVLDTFGYLPEEGSLLNQYTVFEICEYYTALKGMKKDDMIPALNNWLKFFNIEDLLPMKIKKLSKGNRQKIQFIISVLHNPNFIILDEPFSGLDPVSVDELSKAILHLKSQGKTIIFSSHIMNHVESLCNRIILINQGEIILQGSLEEILKSYSSKSKESITLNDIFIDKVGDVDE